jgi:hypothetical protein
MDDALGNALVVEMCDLLAQVEVLEKRWTPSTGFERVIGVGNPQALRSGQVFSGLSAGVEIRRLPVGFARRTRGSGRGLVGIAARRH